jgi:lysozyme
MPEGLNAVVDVSHHNGEVDFVKLREAGILGVIHKATQGVSGVDPTYIDHRAKAQEAGLLWGAYHFGTDADGVQQAIHFLDTVGDPSSAVVALDFEANPTGPSMSLEEARAFVTHIRNATGRYPGPYSGHYVKELLGSSTDTVLANCWFWLAQYGPTAVVPANWTDWKLWQYTDGALGPEPREVPGAGRFDRDLFNGSADDLRTFWGT